MSRRQRPGVTIIELVVVIACIGVLLAILLPAVSAMRSASRGANCAANLRQIGLACHSYAVAYGVFPSAMTASRSFQGKASGVHHYSAFTHLLPYLGAESVYERINFSVPFDIDPETGQRDEATAVRLSVFLCPADGQELPEYAGTVNYRVNLGIGPFNFLPTRAQGAFVTFEWLGPAEFSDGMGNTVAVAERLIGDAANKSFDVRRDFWPSGIARLGRPSLEQAIRACEALTNPTPPHFSWSGFSWAQSGYSSTFYNHAVTPNSPIRDCSIDDGGVVTGGGVFGPRSFHSGGVSCLAGDGAVTFVSDSVDLDVWRALGTRAAGETPRGN